MGPPKKVGPFLEKADSLIQGAFDTKSDKSQLIETLEELRSSSAVFILSPS